MQAANEPALAYGNAVFANTPTKLENASALAAASLGRPMCANAVWKPAQTEAPVNAPGAVALVEGYLTGLQVSQIK
jgi:hypothetical protein